MIAFDLRRAYALDVFEPDEDADNSPMREAAMATVFEWFNSKPVSGDDDGEDDRRLCPLCRTRFGEYDQPAQIYIAQPLPRTSREGRAVRVGPICGDCSEMSDVEIDRALGDLASLWAKDVAP